MTTATSNLVFENFARVALRKSGLANRRQKSPLRIAILPEEQISLPKASAWRLRVLAGRAWVTYAGDDYYPAAGESLDIPKDRYGAIVSSIGADALLFEID